MTVSSSARAALPSAVDTKRRLFLIWQNPDTRQFIRVGKLSELVDGRYVFEYTGERMPTASTPWCSFPT